MHDVAQEQCCKTMPVAPWGKISIQIEEEKLFGQRGAFLACAPSEQPKMISLLGKMWKQALQLFTVDTRQDACRYTQWQNRSCSLLLGIHMHT
jgi:hypothetical protein